MRWPRRSFWSVSDRPDHRVLGGVVDPEPLRGDEAGHGRGVDDVAVGLLRDHARHEGLHAVDHAPEVDADRPLPVLMGGGVEPAPEGDARVVAEDVHRAELRPGAVGEGAHVGEAAHVGAHRDARCPAFATPAAVSVMPASSRSATTTSAPARAKARQSARPMPLAPPVTTATRSARVLHAPGVWAPPRKRCQVCRLHESGILLPHGLSPAHVRGAEPVRDPAHPRSGRPRRSPARKR